MRTNRAQPSASKVRFALVACTSGLLALIGCTDSAGRSPSTTTTGSAPAARSGAVELRGIAMLDGAAFDAQFIGAVVLDQGLVTPCNTTIPRIRGGRFTIGVYDARTSAGCGRPGARVLFWTYVANQKTYAVSASAWPAVSRPTTVSAAFATAQPQGAAPIVTELDGHVHRGDGTAVFRGRVEARIGSAVCGVASIRQGRDFVGYILSVVGPQARAGCTAGATMTLTVDGVPATQTAINSPDHTMDLDLTVP